MTAQLIRRLEESPGEWFEILKAFVAERGLQPTREQNSDFVLILDDDRKARVGFTTEGQFRFEETDRRKPVFVPGAGICGDANELVRHLVRFIEGHKNA